MAANAPPPSQSGPPVYAPPPPGPYYGANYYAAPPPAPNPYASDPHGHVYYAPPAPHQPQASGAVPIDVYSPGEGKAAAAGGPGLPGAAAGSGAALGLTERAIRQGFIRKVYAILTLQLAVTFGAVWAFVTVDALGAWIRQHPGVVLGAIIGSMVLVIAMACVGSLRRRFPINYICLALFTACEALVVGVISSYYDTSTVMLAVAVTAAICVGLTIFTFQTKIDFTAYTGVAVALLMTLLLFGLLQIWFRSQMLQT